MRQQRVTVADRSVLPDTASLNADGPYAASQIFLKPFDDRSVKHAKDERPSNLLAVTEVVSSTGCGNRIDEVLNHAV